MCHCNILNVKLCNLQLNKLKSGLKMVPKQFCKISSNAGSDSNGENNFSHKLLLTNAQFSRLCKTFANNSSANMKLLKTQLHRIVQSGRFFSKILGALLKTALPLMKNIFKPLAKRFGKKFFS